MRFWNGEPRAVVPPDWLLSQRNVVSPSHDDVTNSPYPFGLAVYTSSKTLGSPTPTLLPLLYVSPQVASDRSRAADLRNAPGVQAGWYVSAEPGLPFEVRVTRVNNRTVGHPDEDCFRVSVDVDETPVHWTHLFRDAPHLPQDLTEAIFTGYVEKCGFCPLSSTYERTLRPFAFSKRDPAEQGAVGGGSEVSDYSSVHLLVDIGREQPRSAVPTETRCYDVKQYQGLSEQTIVKGGMSLSTTRDGTAETMRTHLADFTCADARRLHEAEITIFVREASWMRSRRLVDDDGNPCTHTMYKDLMKKDNAYKAGIALASAKNKGDSVDLVKLEEKSSPMPSAPLEVIDLDAGEAAELIDVDDDEGTAEDFGDVIEVEGPESVIFVS